MDFLKGLAGQLQESSQFQQAKKNLPGAFSKFADNYAGQFERSQEFQQARKKYPMLFSQVPEGFTKGSGKLLTSALGTGLKQLPRVYASLPKGSGAMAMSALKSGVQQLPQAYSQLPGGIAAQREKLLGALGTGREAALKQLQIAIATLEELKKSRAMIDEEIKLAQQALQNELAQSKNNSNPNTDKVSQDVPLTSTNPKGNLGSLFSGLFSGGRRRKTRHGRHHRRRRTTRRR